jgi:hypothetical protein
LQAAHLDWDVVLDEAVRHGVIPFLHHHVATLQPPPAAAQRLEREFAAVARRSLSLTAALVDAVTALRSAGIGVTPFKARRSR